MCMSQDIRHAVELRAYFVVYPVLCLFKFRFTVLAWQRQAARTGHLFRGLGVDMDP